MSIFSSINIPDDVNLILQTLYNAGFESYIVGGCVRDSLLERAPKDWDITTPATPEQVIKIFQNVPVIPTGIKHGTVSVVINDETYEITTFRTDGKYSDNRHPDEVQFARSLEKDLERRDFTINAMAYNQTSGLIDPFYGQLDLKNKIIRCVGNPEQRLEEDALRMLRAIRFSAQLGANIHNETWWGIYNNAHNICHVSSERIVQEINKILLLDCRKIFDVMETNLLFYIIPEVNDLIYCQQNHPRHNHTDVFSHTLNALEYLRNHKVDDLNLYLAALLHDVGKPSTKTVGDDGVTHFIGHEKISSDMAENILKRLKYDNNTIEEVKKLILNHMVDFNPTKRYVRKLLHLFGEDFLNKLFILRLADTYGQSHESHVEAKKTIADFVKILDEVLTENQPVTIRHLSVNGDDLQQVGIKPGRTMGNILKSLMELVLSYPMLNKKFILLTLAKLMWIFRKEQKNDKRRN